MKKFKNIKIFLASNNTNKFLEIQKIIQDNSTNIDLLKISKDIPIIIENGFSYQENAEIKAISSIKYLPINSYILSDDSGLEVDALQGRPGIFSSRYYSMKPFYKNNCVKLIEEMNKVLYENRKAKFICSLCLIKPNKKKVFFYGQCDGYIDKKILNETGFAYDSIFIPNGFNKTFHELGSKIKNQLSHRRQAINQLINYIKINLQ